MGCSKRCCCLDGKTETLELKVPVRPLGGAMPAPAAQEHKH
jgi:hypothetical protein